MTWTTNYYLSGVPVHHHEARYVESWQNWSQLFLEFWAIILVNKFECVFDRISKDPELP
jgi:hypothetical protein